MILIIAYGNSLREDDGAGLVLAEKLEPLLRRFAVDARRIETQQLLPELAAEIAASQPHVVVFVDTRVAAEKDEQVAVQAVRADEAASPGLGHHLTPAAVLTYSAALFDEAPRPAWLVTVPGWHYGYGETLSAHTHHAIFQAFNDPASQLRRLVETLQHLSTDWHNGVP